MASRPTGRTGRAVSRRRRRAAAVNGRRFRVPTVALGSTIAFAGMVAIFAIIIAVPLWLRSDDDMTVNTLGGTVACDGNFPDLYSPGLSPAEARDICTDAQSEETGKRWRITWVAVGAGLVVYGSYWLAQRQGDA